MAKNPFEILGFNAKIFKIMDERQVWRIVRSQYKALVALFHPDQPTANEARFREITEAYESINYDSCQGDFMYWLQELMKPSKKKIDVLQGENEGLMDRIRFLEAHRHFQHQVMVGAYEFDELHFNVFRPQRIRILCSDVQSRSALGSFLTPGMNLSEAGFIFALDIFLDGTMERCVVHKVWTAKESPPEDILPRWEYVSPQRHRSYWWKRVGNPEPVEGLCLLGGMSNIELDARGITFRNSQLTALLPGEKPEKRWKQSKEGFTYAMFEPFLDFVRPIVTESDLLIASRNIEGELRYFVVGAVVRIHVYES